MSAVAAFVSVDAADVVAVESVATVVELLVLGLLVVLLVLGVVPLAAAVTEVSCATVPLRLALFEDSVEAPMVDDVDVDGVVEIEAVVLVSLVLGVVEEEVVEVDGVCVASVELPGVLLLVLLSEPLALNAPLALVEVEADVSAAFADEEELGVDDE